MFAESIMLLRCILTAAFASALAACAATDTYSVRAESYNTEAQDLSNELLIRNILRASHRLPLQFTDIQSLTGQTTSTASIGLSTPVGGFPANTPRTINPSVGGTLQTTFQGVVLDSQDFYQGVSAPISGQQAAYFVKSVKPSELIFSLLFSRVAISRGDDDCKKRGYYGDCTVSFANDPRNLRSAALFHETLTYLLRLGLSMEVVSLWNRETHEDTKDGKGGKKTDVTSTIFKDGDKRTVARYCFRPPDTIGSEAIVDGTFLCGTPNAFASLTKNLNDQDQSPVIKLRKDMIKTYIDTVDDNGIGKTDESGVDFDDQPKVLKSILKKFQNTPVRIEFTPRSTLDLFDYLGSIVAASEHQGRQVSDIRGVVEKRLAYPACDQTPDDPSCSPIFALSTVRTPDTMSFNIDGQRFYLATADGRPGNTTQTLAILKQILGLNTVSKNVPLPAIITGTIVP